MDKYEREQLTKRAGLILGEISLNMAESDLVDHASKKYEAMVGELSIDLEEIKNLESTRDGKGFFSRLGDKINGISQEDRKIDEILTDCSKRIRRLERCKGCLCLDCVRDECKFNCSVCTDGGRVLDCPGDGSGYCFRQVEKWYTELRDITTKKVQYEILAMLSDINTGKHYLFLKGRTNDYRRVVLYERTTGLMQDITNEEEHKKITEAAARMIGY